MDEESLHHIWRRFIVWLTRAVLSFFYHFRICFAENRTVTQKQGYLWLCCQLTLEPYKYRYLLKSHYSRTNAESNRFRYYLKLKNQATKKTLLVHKYLDCGRLCMCVCFGKIFFLYPLTRCLELHLSPLPLYVTSILGKDIPYKLR